MAHDPARLHLPRLHAFKIHPGRDSHGLDHTQRRVSAMQRSWQALGAGHEHHPHRCPDSRPRQRVDGYRLGVLSRPPIRRAQPEGMTQHNSPVCSMGSASVASVRMRSAMMAPDRGSRASSIAERALLHVSTTSCSVSSPTNNRGGAWARQ
ncbi:hypothetical protein B1C76_12610 [Cutibacterium acnes subsp. defendens]|nr:hypothetical protein B1C76_12610 [Cutibacterium acnes subsp. defendens]